MVPEIHQNCPSLAWAAFREPVGSGDQAHVQVPACVAVVVLVVSACEALAQPPVVSTPNIFGGQKLRWWKLQQAQHFWRPGFLFLRPSDRYQPAQYFWWHELQQWLVFPLEHFRWSGFSRSWRQSRFPRGRISSVGKTSAPEVAVSRIFLAARPITGAENWRPAL